jgi:phosphonate transport system ATP-binding protein
LLEITNLTKVYPGGTVALDGVDLTVPDGQFLAVIGLSGSGKSTLMRCINRLIEPTSGSITIDGVDVTAAKPEGLRDIRRRIGMVFQQFNLVKRSSVLTNTLVGRLGYASTWGSLLHRFSREDHELAMANLGRVGIADKAHQRADTLSGGQQQRVGIARALMQQPDLILADEPVASLDPATAHSILDHLEQVNKQDGITVLCSLHFLSLARRYADRVVALKAGRIVFDGTPDEIDNARFREIYGEDAEEVEVE